MRKFLKITLQFYFACLASISVQAQSSDCITLEGSQKKLYLNGNNFTLIDNALRCFKLNSIAEQDDSIVRIWMLEDNFPDTPTTWRVKMFEFGKKGGVPFAILHILEWNYERDSSFPVKCIKQQNIGPKQGWLAFEKDIRRLNLSTLYAKPLAKKGPVFADYGMLIIQFLFGHNTYSIDFSDSTGLLKVSDPKNFKISDNSRKIAYLLWYVEKHFSFNFLPRTSPRLQ